MTSITASEARKSFARVIEIVQHEAVIVGRCGKAQAVVIPPPGAKALRGRDALRIRVGDYRIIYTVQDDRLLVIVVTLGHRCEVYR